MSLEIVYSDVQGTVKRSGNIQKPQYINEAISNWESHKDRGSPDIPYATAENNVWKLDGSRKLLKGEGEFLVFGDGTGYTDVTVTFEKAVQTSGITIRFSPSTNQFPEMVRISWKYGNAAVYEKTYYPNSPVLHALEQIGVADTVSIYIKAKENEFIKIQRIAIGNEIVLTEKNLSSVQMTTEFDPSLCTLPTDTLSFKAKIREGVVFEPSERDRIEVYKDDALLHTMFIQDFDKITKEQYRIKCQSLIGTLDRKYYGKILTPGGVIDSDDRDGNVWCTSEKEINRISQGGKRFSVNYETTNGQEKTILIGYIPICSEKEALQQVLFASDMAASTRTGELTFVDLTTEVTSDFSANNIIAWHEVKKLTPISRVEVYSTEEEYVKQEISEEFRKNELVETPRILHYIPEPVWVGGKLVVTQISGSYGAGWIVMKENEDITGNAYIEHRKIKHSRVVGDYEKDGTTITVEGCTLIHNEMLYQTEWEGFEGAIGFRSTDSLNTALTRMEKCANLRVLVEETVVITNQRAGDYVRTLTPWGITVVGYIISMDSELTKNGHRAKIKILGKEAT